MKFEEVEVNSERWFDITPLLNEKWKEIYNGRYQVSNYGRVKSMFFNNRQASIDREKILKSVKRNENSYYSVNIYKNNKAHLINVHRLVAESFLENTNNYRYVNHKDENKLNNRIDNLEFCTQKYNCNFGSRNKRISAKNINKPKSKFEKVIQYDLKENFIKEYKNVCVATRETGIGHLRECYDGKRKTAGGYIFKYKNELLKNEGE